MFVDQVNNLVYVKEFVISLKYLCSYKIEKLSNIIDYNSNVNFIAVFIKNITHENEKLFMFKIKRKKLYYLYIDLISTLSYSKKHHIAPLHKTKLLFLTDKTASEPNFRNSEGKKKLKTTECKLRQGEFSKRRV